MPERQRLVIFDFRSGRFLAVEKKTFSYRSLYGKRKIVNVSLGEFLRILL